MSPDELSVGRFIDAVVRRQRRLGHARLVAWTIVAGGAAAEVALLARLPIVVTGLCVAVAAFVVVMLWRRPTRAAALARVERFDRRFRNLLVTADELRTGQSATLLRDRVFADTAAVATRVDVAAALPAAPSVRLGACAMAIVFLAAATLLAGRRLGPSEGASLAPAGTPKAGSGRALRIVATIQPPAYMHLQAHEEIDPAQISAPQGSALRLTVMAPDRVLVAHDGRALTGGAVPLQPGQIFHDTLDRTGFLVVDAGPTGRRTMPIVVAPDALPDVRITAPGRDLVFAGSNPRVSFEVRATDDFGLAGLALLYTKVSGSGERFDFTEGEIPLAIDRRQPREWHASAARALADLDLHDGDTLVYRAVAADARGPGGTTTSDAFFIELSKLGVAAGDAFTLPEQETRYALSEQMLIVKTDRLDRARGTMAPPDFGEAATNLGLEQRMIRAEFVFMLGGEVEDEDVEAEQSTELQEGRLQNHGQRDLRTATVAMSRAEQWLTAGDTKNALAAEHAAVEALQRAFAKDRYILRALATRTELDPSRRLTGDLARAADWHRRLPDTVENRRVAQLQDVLRGIGALAADAGAGRLPSRARLQVLAEQAIAADASSAALRDAAVSLQRIGDAPRTATDAAATLTAISARVAAEARRALADGSLAPPVAPSLRGAFADALKGAPR